MDQTLPARRGRRRAEADPTFAEYDAAIRQCGALDQELSEEAEVLRGVLAAGSAIAVTRDAQAGEKFTVLAAVSAVALGLPALVLALYGASDYLPFTCPTSFDSYRLLYPVLLAGVLPQDSRPPSPVGAVDGPASPARSSASWSSSSCWPWRASTERFSGRTPPRRRPPRP